MKPDEYRKSKIYPIVFSELINAAKYRGYVTYQEVAKLVGLPLTGNYMGNELGTLLGAISEDEVKRGRPMLSAIVVDKNEKIGPGFFPWAKQLGRMKEGEDEEEFLERERKAVYDQWKVILKEK